MNPSSPESTSRRREPARFTGREERSITLLCAIYALRILGMYMVLPVLSPYAGQMRGASGVMTGLALGAYGLTQAAFQIPFGVLSDRIGRKRAIFVGLMLFAAGSAVAAWARTAPVLVVGRLIQGTGAVASAVVALTADLTRPEVRTQAMARIGVWLGASFAIGMTSGGFFARVVGVPGLFWGTAAASVLGGFLLLLLIPEPSAQAGDGRLHANEIGAILHQRPLVALYLGTFLLHLTLTAIFVILPLSFQMRFGEGQIWKLLVPLIVIGLVAMTQIARFSDREKRSFDVLLGGGVLLAASCTVFAIFGVGGNGLYVALFLFILAIAGLEPVLPSLTTRLAGEGRTGAVTGGFHMSQFLGSFLGGFLGGLFLVAGARSLFLILAVAAGLWVLLAYVLVRSRVRTGP
ncbi:MAG: MFS transporter [Candidatus Eisenbacteria bacterium]|uniref:MFS transporter n=1 Tax=Eiseniibacteriota bacterium TaxID=2212470 RepID=A0A956LYE0_UNCEI|nr:MFS transporter [Candidatus Eisenbacteria bacterium]